ncbi:hypothetical protein SDA20_07190 [Legionella pneumophila serogroup 1]|nr:hypothetical protein [Legionella pneumophila]HDO9973839.1 hypothetical protein [Legionella pneumophila]
MNNTGFKTIFFLIGVLLLGCSLMSCTKTTATETHPESGYEGGFGGDGGHRHQEH